ncbi:hypothetical protein GCT19_31305 [Paraburkholderia sp. CNPSo 3155]|nr:hypothetical protein [Paraburkholderia atlantica]
MITLRLPTGCSRANIFTAQPKEELKKTIARVRRQGWAIVDQKLEGGLFPLSTQIHDRHGRVIAAMNISGNAQLYSAEHRPKKERSSSTIG